MTLIRVYQCDKCKSQSKVRREIPTQIKVVSGVGADFDDVRTTQYDLCNSCLQDFKGWLER